MDTYKVIKNGLVLTLDRKGNAGYFNIIIKNNKIFLIDYERTFNEKEFCLNYPEAEIIDAKDKLIMPGLFNSKSVSSYSLNRIFFKKCSYQDINSLLSLKLADKFLSDTANAGLFKDLLKNTYTNSLLNGEIFINECSPSLNKEFLDLHYEVFKNIHQYFNITTYDLKIKPDEEKKITIGFTAEESTNNYSLSSIKKNLAGSKTKLIIEASFSEKTFESIKKVFGRNLIPVLAEMDLISSDTIISNPTHLNQYETDILIAKNATVLICPSDYLNLSYKKAELTELMLSGVNIITGTGYTGNNILSELRKLSVMVSGNNISFENILRTAVNNPSDIFGISNLTGTIEKNKIADLILFDLKHSRNCFTLPETNKEYISEFILDNLDVNNICDVFLKGENLIKDRIKNFNYSNYTDSGVNEIAQRIYSAGKYFELLEKDNIRTRVENMDSKNSEETENKNKIIFVKTTETGEYEGEGEFTIIRTKEEEFEKPRDKDKTDAANSINIKEIKSFENDMNLFEEEAITEEIVPKKKGRRVYQRIDAKEIDDKIKTDETIKTDADIKPDDTITEEYKPTGIKLVKLKFGFKEDE